MIETQANEMIETLRFENTDETFRKGARLGRSGRNGKTSRFRILPEIPKLGGELRVAIMDKKSRVHPHVIEPHRCVPGLPKPIRLFAGPNWPQFDIAKRNLAVIALEGDVSAVRFGEKRHGVELALSDALLEIFAS